MSAVRDLKAAYRDISALRAAISLMNWDFQVLAPSGGTTARSAQISILTRREHELATSDEMRRLLERARAEVEAGTEDAAMVRVLTRDIDRAVALPVELVERKSKVSGDAYATWRRAKPENDFKALEPYYRELFSIAEETSLALGSGDHIYDRLIDLYEEGATYATARALFDDLEPFTTRLVADIRENGAPIDDRPLIGPWDPQRLRAFAAEILSEIGFEFQNGRLDVANNAFCTTIATSDVRMTTRPSDHIKGIVSSSIHEMGHALYEQHSPARYDGTPLRGGVSLAVHESQSRTWENVVGRCEAFWRRFTPTLHRHLPELADESASSLHRMLNKVEPTFVRVGADELTYNLHILIRFELEVEILTHQIDVKDLPEAWNEKYQSRLGIIPETDTQGCLQDVHWTRGSIGYFPTYSFGNVIGLQIWNRLVRDLGDVDGPIERGEFAPILAWLVENVYSKARLHTPADLVKSICGEAMSANDWLRYADGKYRSLYRL